jgi:hypothetical protein
LDERDRETARQSAPALNAGIYLAATLADGMSNLFVAVLGGPGKGSYNPHPVRKSLGLPIYGRIEMSPEEYRQYQDSCEGVAFALGGVQRSPVKPPQQTTYGKDAVQSQQAFMSARQEAIRSGSGRFEAMAPTSYIKSNLNRGSLSFEIASSPGAPLRGKEMFDMTMSYFGPAVKQVEGNWRYGDNLKVFNELTAKNVSPIEAAKATWTGQQAARHGYTEASIKAIDGKKGDYYDVSVIFTKPK